MKVLLVVDHFGSGGAQRQIVELACGLKERGHDVEMFIYHPQYDFFRSRLADRSIIVHEYRKGPGFSLGVVRELASLMRGGGFDVVVSYLSAANIYAEVAAFLARSTTLVVSERTSHHDDQWWLGAYLRRRLHGVARWVVANSHAQCEWLLSKPWLVRKVSCIYNGVDLSTFYPVTRTPESPRELRLIAVGRVGPEKNVLNVIAALALLHQRLGYIPKLTWIGRRDESPAGQRYCRQVDDALEASPAVRKHWCWLDAQPDIAARLATHHALIHASFYEGLPNAICEALAAGMPVLASEVCDHPLLVRDGQRGFLFDPTAATSIAHAIERLIALDADGWRSFGRNAREYAEAELGVDKMVTAYESLFATLLS